MRPSPGNVLHVAQRLMLTALLLLVVRVEAQQPEQTAGSVWQISGKVVDARSGVALSRCSVEINPVTHRGAPRSLMTAEDGQFLFAGLPPGKYRLMAGKRGFIEQAYEAHGNFSTAIAVGPGRISDGILFKLTPMAVLSGTVSDERGEPVRRAQVRLFEDQDAMGIRSTTVRQQAITDDRGIYEIASVQPGNYYLVVSGTPWYARTIQTSPGVAQDAESNAALDVAYPTTFYPQATDSEEATPIPIRGGERLQADVTLNAQHAMRLRFKLPVEDPEHQGSYNVMLSQSLFGQPEPAQGVQNVHDGMLEIDGVMPGHYEVTLDHYAPNGGHPREHPLHRGCCRRLDRPGGRGGGRQRNCDRQGDYE